MFWKWLPKRKGPAALPPANPQQNTPAIELEAFGPVVRENHIAYIPVKSWSRVPGVGTANLVYAPDFLLSPPQWLYGLGFMPQQGMRILNRPAVITRPKQTLEGVGGITAGQFIHQPLLEMQITNGQLGVGGE